MEELLEVNKTKVVLVIVEVGQIVITDKGVCFTNSERRPHITCKFIDLKEIHTIISINRRGSINTQFGINRDGGVQRIEIKIVVIWIVIILEDLLLG